MSISSGNIYNEYLGKAMKAYLSNEERIATFKEVIPFYLENKLSNEEFGQIAGNLYFRKDGIGVGEKESPLDWIMYFGADAAFQGEQYKKQLKFYFTDPVGFTKWWKENINQVSKNSIELR